jgi:hypothetical protein
MRSCASISRKPPFADLGLRLVASEEVVYFCRSGARSAIPNCALPNAMAQLRCNFRGEGVYKLFSHILHASHFSSSTPTPRYHHQHQQHQHPSLPQLNFLISSFFKYRLPPQIYHGRHQVDGNHPPLYDAMILLIRSLSSCVLMLAQLERNVVS